MPITTLIMALVVSSMTLHAGGQRGKPPLLPPPPPPSCPTAPPPLVAMRATIVNDGNAVQDDGLGEYVDLVEARGRPGRAA
jgi:hypothetical protein